MGHEFCKGWTDNQLQMAFTRAHMSEQQVKEKAREAAYWRDMAYIAMLTGADRPVHPGYRH